MIQLVIAGFVVCLLSSEVLAQLQNEIPELPPKTLHFPQSSSTPPPEMGFGGKVSGYSYGSIDKTNGTQTGNVVMEFSHSILDPTGRRATSVSTVLSHYRGLLLGDVFPVHDTLYRVSRLEKRGVWTELVLDHDILKQYAPLENSQCCSFSPLKNSHGPIPVLPFRQASATVLIRDQLGPDDKYWWSNRPRREGDFIRWPSLAGRMRIRRIVPPDRDNHIMGWLELEQFSYEELAHLPAAPRQDCSPVAPVNEIVMRSQSETEPDDRLRGDVAGAGWVYPWNNEPKASLRFFEFCDLPGELRSAYGFLGMNSGDLIPVKGSLYSIGAFGPEVTLTRVAQLDLDAITPSRRSAIVAINTERTSRSPARIGESEIVVIEHTSGDKGIPKTVTWLRYPILRDSIRLTGPAKETVSEGDIVELFEPSGKVPVRVQRIVLPDPEKRIVGWVEIAPVDAEVK